MIAADILAALGRALRWGAWRRCRCPVHASRGPTLALRDGEGGLIAKCYAGCAPAGILAELRRSGLLLEATDHQLTPCPTRPDARDDSARQISAAQRISGAPKSPVASYLACRGITIAPLPSLRWAPTLHHRDDDGAAMVARIDNIDGELIEIARTWLTRDAAGVWRRFKLPKAACAA